jgi:hypothetical protein
VIIVKEVVVGTDQAATAPDNFLFDPSAGINSDTNFLLDDDTDILLPKQQTFSNVLPGQHTVVEVAPAAPGDPGFGWELRTITCVDPSNTDDGNPANDSSGNPGTRTATIQLAPGETVTCTFFNHQAEMPVTKLIDGRTPVCTTNGQTTCTDPVMGNVTGLFGIQLFATGFPGGFPNNPLSQIIPIPPVFEPPAPIGIPFTICERDIPLGWKLLATDDVVLNAIPNQVADTTPTVYDPAPTSRNRCFDVLIPNGTTEFAISINNVPLSKIIVKKLTVPTGLGPFTFTPTGFNSGNPFDLSHNQQNDSGFIPGGSGYAVAETLQAAFDLTPISCSATIPGTQNGGAGTSSFTYTGGGGGDSFALGDHTANITLQNGATVTCTFTNKRKPTIQVIKTCNPMSDNGLFDLMIGTANGAFSPSFTKDDATCTDTGGGTNTTGPQSVAPGSGHAVAETGNTAPPPLGNTLLLYSTDVSCTLNGGLIDLNGGDSGTSLTNINALAPPGNPTNPIVVGLPTLAYGDNVVCTYTNKRKATMPLNKLVNGGDPTLVQAPFNSWTFNLFNTNGGAMPAGYLVQGPPIGTVAVPPQANLLAPVGIPLTICEMGPTVFSNGNPVPYPNTGLPPGWEAFWTVSVGLVANPNGELAPYDPDVENGGQSVGVRCININVPAGTPTISITVDNRSPGGAQRTIGYWSNWNTCARSNGNQVLNASKTGKTLLDQVLPINLGPLQIRECVQGVHILRKETLNGEKVANDAAYSMAAQLLAAKANVAAGAGVCSAATSNIAAADQLLTTLGFNGIDPELPPKSDQTQRNLALVLAAALDSYNNGILCPTF